MNKSLGIHFHLHFTLLLLVAFGQLGRLSFFNQQINVYAYEIILLLYLLYGLYTYGFKPLYKPNQIAKRLLIFFLYLSISWVLSVFWYSNIENLVSSLYLIRLWLYGLFSIYLYYEKVQRKLIFIRFPIWVFIGFTVVTSFIQYWLYPNLRNLEYLGWDPHLYRMFGLFFDPPIAAGVYGLCLLAVWFEKVFKHIYWKICLSIILFAMILLTYSRGAYLAIFVISIIYGIRKRLFKQLFIGVVLFITLLFLLPKTFGEGVNLLRTSTISSRIADYNSAITIWQKSPIIGIGYNHIRAEKRIIEPNMPIESSHAGASFHSSFLIVLVTGGIVGLLLFINYLYGVVQLNSFSFYSSLFLSVMSLTDNVLLHPFILCIWFIMICYSILPCDKSL